MATKPRSFDRKAPNWPKEAEALRRLEKQIELGKLGDLTAAALPQIPRYVVTYMNSQTGGRIRSATVVSVTNQAKNTNRVFVSYFKGFTGNTSPVSVCSFAIPPNYTVDFCTRNLPVAITVCTCVSNPELVFDEGRAIASSMWPEIAVSS